ncbi:hypothetical protein J2750_001593 [Methanococcoides alaskense]|uniref:Uncharacterized protein n=1 Tax=Methanococcoides alaskense TaxID=325778 RepID=A0AA90Z916_9EURY|nr:hypothetical protein [Methanococcoides alaskense]
MNKPKHFKFDLALFQNSHRANIKKQFMNSEKIEVR